MTDIHAQSIKKIAIVGAGPSGLTVAKYLLAENHFSEIDIYEQRDGVGGTWNFAPLVTENPSLPNGHAKRTPTDVVTARTPRFNTPMYEGLESNLPTMLMQFSDTPFPPSTQLFAPRDEVLQYLEHYAKELAPMLRFNHEVIEVKPIEENGHRWSVTTRNRELGDMSAKPYDAVVVASGHCDRPSLPEIEGLDEWAQRYPESLIHSLSYRNVEPFRNKRILIVGGGPSAADIGHQIAQVCKYPMISSRPQPSPYHMEEPNEVEVPNLACLISDDGQRTAIFQDGTVEQDIDIVFLCTGYAYDFPFLRSVYPTVADDGIHAIHPYQYVFNITNPTLAFVETLEQIVPFGLAESQAAVIARVWSGRLTLPSRDAMNAWVGDIVRQRGKGRSFHAVKPPLDLAYMREMYDWSQRAESGSKLTVGRTARQWDDYFCWLRMAAAEMKKAFIAKGADRTNITRYEELGFQYDGAPFVF